MSYIGEDVLRKLYTEDKMAMKEIAYGDTQNKERRDDISIM